MLDIPARMVVSALAIGLSVLSAPEGAEALDEQYLIKEYVCTYKHPTPVGPIAFSETVNANGRSWSGFKASWHEATPRDFVRLEVDWSERIGLQPGEIYSAGSPARLDPVKARVRVYFETPRRLPAKALLQIGSGSGMALRGPLEDAGGDFPSASVDLYLPSLRGYLLGSLGSYSITKPGGPFSDERRLHHGRLDLGPIDVAQAELEAGFAKFREVTADFRNVCKYHEYETRVEDVV